MSIRIIIFASRCSVDLLINNIICSTWELSTAIYCFVTLLQMHLYSLWELLSHSCSNCCIGISLFISFRTFVFYFTLPFFPPCTFVHSRIYLCVCMVLSFVLPFIRSSKYFLFFRCARHVRRWSTLVYKRSLRLGCGSRLSIDRMRPALSECVFQFYLVGARLCSSG